MATPQALPDFSKAFDMSAYTDALTKSMLNTQKASLTAIDNYMLAYTYYTVLWMAFFFVLVWMLLVSSIISMIVLFRFGFPFIMNTILAWGILNKEHIWSLIPPNPPPPPERHRSNDPDEPYKPRG